LWFWGFGAGNRKEREKIDRKSEKNQKKGVKLYSGAAARSSWPAGHRAGHPTTHRNSAGVLKKKELVKRERERERERERAVERERRVRMKGI